MCGRYQITSPVEAVIDLIQAFGSADTSINSHYQPNQNDWPKCFNAAPSMHLPVISFQPKRRTYTLSPMHWGLIPTWAKDIRNAGKTINARLETAATKPSFREAMEKRHAIIPVTAYYEWQTLSQRKQPFRLHFKDDEPLLLAGIWSRWQDTEQPETKINSFSILTTTAEFTPNVAEIHHRMPLALTPEDAGAWLDKSLDLQADEATSTITRNAEFLSHPVSQDLNRVSNQSESLIRAIDLKIEQSVQSDLFE